MAAEVVRNPRLLRGRDLVGMIAPRRKILRKCEIKMRIAREKILLDHGIAETLVSVGEQSTRGMSPPNNGRRRRLATQLIVSNDVSKIRVLQVTKPKRLV